MKFISDNWVVKNLENAIGTWNEKLAELWQLITQTPETFKGGQIWAVIVNINSALVGIGYGLLVLFFAMGVFQSAASFRELQRPEFAGEGASAMGKAFVKSYVGVCLEGAVIVLACLIYSAFLSSSAPSVDSSLPAVTMVWQYIGQLIFNMLILTGLVKGSDRVVREMFSL